MNKSNAEALKKFIKAYNTFDIGSMISLLHPEVQFRNISNGEMNTHTSGLEEFEKLALNAAKIFKEREQKIISYTEDNNKINVEIEFHAVPEENILGLSAGENIHIYGRSEYLFKDGLIISIMDES